MMLGGPVGSGDVFRRTTSRDVTNNVIYEAKVVI